MDFSSRPATAADAQAIYELIAAAEQEWHGQVEVIPDQVAADLVRPELDPERDTLVVHAGNGDLAAWAWVHLGRHAQVNVLPSYRSAGIGTMLIGWVEERAREVGSDWVAQIVDDADKAGTGLLQSRGYDVLATNWLLERPIDGPRSPEPVAGLRLGSYDAMRTEEVYELVEDAFSEFQPRRKSFAEFAGLTVERSTFRPDASTLAYIGGEVVGAVISLDLPNSDEGYVERLAVRADHRNQGIARAMLDETCAVFHRLGRRSCILWTHSGTGALAMYERLGMHVRRSTTVYRTNL